MSKYDKSDDKPNDPTPALPPTVDGQCQEPGCKSTRVPNGDPYTCPVHAPKV
jgi:hypothetical protein